MPNINFSEAPKLVNNKQTSSNNFYQIPQNVADKIFEKCGRSSAQIRIMMVLIGTKTGFGVSNEWIRQRTGLIQQNYSRAMNELENKSFITRKDKEIIINYDEILK